MGLDAHAFEYAELVEARERTENMWDEVETRELEDELTYLYQPHFIARSDGWVNFADNDGFLGPRTCALLAEQSQLFDPWDVLSDFERDRWLTWLDAFKLTADTGVIVYG